MKLKKTIINNWIIRQTQFLSGALVSVWSPAPNLPEMFVFLNLRLYSQDLHADLQNNDFVLFLKNAQILY